MAARLRKCSRYRRTAEGNQILEIADRVTHTELSAPTVVKAGRSYRYHPMIIYRVIPYSHIDVFCLFRQGSPAGIRQNLNRFRP